MSHSKLSSLKNRITKKDTEYKAMLKQKNNIISKIHAENKSMNGKIKDASSAYEDI